MEGRKDSLHIAVPPKLAQLLQDLVNAGLFMSKREAVRYAVWRLVRRYRRLLDSDSGRENQGLSRHMTFSVGEWAVEGLQRLVKEGWFTSLGEAVRFAILDALDGWMPPPDGEPADEDPRKPDLKVFEAVMKALQEVGREIERGRSP